MLGELPKALNICGIDRAIRTDFRVALIIMQAFNDTELNAEEKMFIMCDSLYLNFDSFASSEIESAVKLASLFIDGKLTESACLEGSTQTARLLDWEQDEQIIFSAINKVAGCEIRALPYLHWWTFLGYFNEIGEGLLATVINIRQKKANGKKLEKHEQEFYRKHKNLVDIKQTYTAEEQAEIDRLNKMLD